MKKVTGMAVFALILCGCASQGEMRHMENTNDANQKTLRENEIRINNLENSVTALNTQIAQLNNRVYEVRTRGGQKTSMTVVPINPVHAAPASPATQPVSQSGNAVTPAPEPAPVSQPVAASQPASPSPAKTPVGKKIDPAARPTPMPTRQTPAPVISTPAPPPVAASRPRPSGASGSVGQPEAMAGPSGQISTSAPDELGLPPAEIPVPGNNTEMTTSIMAPASTAPIQPQRNNATDTPVPVPLIPESDLSLPPEHPDLAIPAPAGQTSPPVAAPAQTARAHTPAAPARSPQKGEEAAYTAALNAARSGRAAEGIRLFQDFLRQYPNGKYAANADFWIGECMYSQGNLKGALEQYQEVNNTFPTHHKNADALYKAAVTLGKMGDKAGAQEKFRQLVNSFPNSDAAKRARSMGYGR